MTEEPLDVDRLRAFVRGELDDVARAEIEALLDRRADARQVLGVLAREGGRATDRDPHVGALLGGRYRIRRRLGAGGMGVVYEAEHELLGRRVALKMLHPEHAERAEVRRRFENEARAVAALDHPNVVAAFDVGRTPDGAPFVVYELLAGDDLEARLVARGALPIVEVLALGRGIAAGLAAAHALGIVHRDLKPANVFVTDGGVPKILDFGVSKLAPALHLGTTTRTGAFMGTPAYMAPEQLRDAASVDARADVYALGVVLHRMLTGAMPHAHATLGELLAAHDRPPPSSRAKRPEVPEALDALVQLCLAPDRAARPHDARAVHDAIARIAESSSSSARASTRPPDDRRLVTALVADRSLDEAAVREAGGRVLHEEPDDAPPFTRHVAIFGESGWSRERQEAALRIALAQRDDVSAEAPHDSTTSRGSSRKPPSTGLFVIGVARHDRTHDRVEGDALETFARARDRGARGVLVSAELTSAFPSVSLEELAPGLHRVRDATDRVFAPFVGREVELAQLRAAIESVEDERRARIVRVEGPPGIGKTRLVERALADLQEHGSRVARVAASPELEELALLRAWIEKLTSADTLEQLVASRILEPSGLASLLGRDTASDPQLRVDRARLAAMAALAGCARARAIVLVLEDAHDASRGLLEAVERLAERELALVIVLVSRVELPLAGAHVELLTLRGLRRRATAELARALASTSGRPRSGASEPSPRDVDDGNLDAPRHTPHLDGPHLDEAALDALYERTEGNPLFVEQLVWGPHHADDPRGTEGIAGGDAVPATIEAALQARLDALPPREREGLETAAVLDAPFDADDLRALGHHDADDVVRALRRRELLVREGERHRIGSSLVAATAKRALSDERRRALHAAIAAHCIREARAAATIARHLDEAGDAEAGAWHLRAARDAAARGEGGAVIRHGERALTLGRREVALVLAEAYELTGRLDDEARVLEGAEESAEVLARLAIVALRRGDPAAALTLFERAELTSTHADASTRAKVAGRHAVAALYAGRLDEARRRLDDAERIVWVHAPELRAEAAIWRAQLAAAAGDLGERRHAYWAAVELYRERGDVRRRAQASVNLADVDNRLGAYDDAVRALRIALNDCAALGLEHAAAYAHANLAYALVRLGRVDEALAAIARARDVAARVGDRRLTQVCELYSLRARLTRGEDVRVDALELACSLEATSPPLAALAFACAARAALPSMEALASAERAAALVAELGTIEEDEAEVALVHAEALDAAGRPDAAREVRAIARAGILAAARRIADPAWRERFLHDVPAHRALLAST
ncbi:MAG: protein kinase [Myxococcota bacterium]|nr:protein kinase [Myxococcota bacterium]